MIASLMGLSFLSCCSARLPKRGSHALSGIKTVPNFF